MDRQHFEGRVNGARVGVIAAFVAALFLMVPGMASAQMRVSGGLEQFSWSEYTTGGTKILDESGQRIALGFTWLPTDGTGFLVGYNGRLYSGTVKYTGRATDSTGTAIPFGTNTGYGGMLNELLLHYRLDTGTHENGAHHLLDIVAALGVDTWTRDIKSAGTISGYKETYTLTFLRVGFEMLPKTYGPMGAAGVKYPFSASEKVGLSGAGYDADVTVKPKPDFTMYASVGYQFNNPWSVSLAFDSYFLRPSDFVDATKNGTTAGIGQPESKMEIITLSAGYRF